MTNRSPALNKCSHFAPTSTNSPQNSCPRIVGLVATSFGTRLWSAPCKAALWLDMQTLSEMTLASISYCVSAGSSNSSNRKSFFPYNLTAFVRIAPRSLRKLHANSVAAVRQGVYRTGLLIVLSNLTFLPAYFPPLKNFLSNSEATSRLEPAGPGLTSSITCGSSSRFSHSCECS